MTQFLDRHRQLKAQVDERLAAIYPEGPHLLVEPIKHVLSNGGKRLRPILTMLSAEACGASPADALHAAAAVEVLHNFTLVHDDVMDRDNIRHGQPTVHTVWDEGVAILTGDAMFINALAELRLNPGDVEEMSSVFIRGALAVCEGQALDKEFETRNDVTRHEYLQMIDLKTGHLLGLAAELGAIVARAPAGVIACLRNFGQLLGRAFQIQDDLLEIFSDTATMGKSLGSDLVAQKKTYPVVAAAEKAQAEVKAALEEAGTDLDSGMQTLRRVLTESGVKAGAEEEIERTVGTALDELRLLGDKATSIKLFADLVLNRKK
ncbi:MAG: polyprenyl synthetase family protein [Candidatus Marinimicrobia bacterium]|nr:polyprenyl synthetase family protein [Candidatus Neomarinimicrobiota bacterium]